jgi:RES domain
MWPLPTVELAQRDTVRLVSTGRLKEPVLLPLATTQGALDDLADLESVTNGRLQAQETGLPDLDPRELAFDRAGHTFINAAFTHTRPGGNRFNGDDRGAWYCAFAVETCLAEVSYHLTRELEAIDRFENVTDYAEPGAKISAKADCGAWNGKAARPRTSHSNFANLVTNRLYADHYGWCEVHG